MPDELDGTEPDSNSCSSLFLSSSRNIIANSSIGLATRLAFVTLSMRPRRESRAFLLADEWLGQCGHGDRMGGTYGRSFGVRPVTSCTRMVNIREQEKPVRVGLIGVKFHTFHTSGRRCQGGL